MVDSVGYLNWSPEQWILIITTTISAVGGLITLVINTINSARRHHEVIGKVNENTDYTVASVVQTQNTNRAIAKAEDKINGQSQELEKLINDLYRRNDELSMRLLQVRAITTAIEDMEVILSTADRQHEFKEKLHALREAIVSSVSDESIRRPHERKEESAT